MKHFEYSSKRTKMGNSSSNDSEFTRKSSSEDVIAQYGDRAAEKYVVVTGGNGGLGFETARVLALKGAVVTIGCRSEKNGAEAVARILAETPEARVSFLQLDLGNFASIRKFAAAYKATGNPLNILINNAGVMACPRTLTSEGLEMQFGTNHIGHFLLTNELMDLIKASGTAEEPSRIINLSSLGQYYFSPPMGIRLDDLKAEKSYDQWERYGSSKLANILFTKQLSRMFSEQHAPVIAVSVHPGVINETNLGRHIDFGNAMNITGKILFKGPTAMYEFFAGDTKNIKQGSATSVYCALCPGVAAQSGAHFADCRVETKIIHPTATDAQLAADLWKASEDIVKPRSDTI